MTCYHNESVCRVYCLPNQNWLIRSAYYAGFPCIVTDADYKNPQLYADNEISLNQELRFLIRTAFECRFAHESIVSLHAACVELSGEAVCFTADSGVGKSTRAKAWVDGLGAEFISGDRPAIRLENGGNVACGVPWDGKEQIFRDVERPLRAILEVRRAPFTRLRRLSAEQAYRIVIRQAFIPMWDPDTAALAMVNVRRLCRTTPVYRLFCGPDEDSARAVHRILFEHPEEIQEELPEMKIKPGFTLRHVVDEYLVMPTGENIKRFGGTVVLNEVSAFIFEQLQQPISREDLLAQMLAEFEVDEATAAADLDALLEQFRALELLEA
ncbi:MAG: PqqD family peptide modification chaperone [Aristaeellaceae bacterium]